MSFNQASIYWIRLPEHTDIYNDGYVGVSCNFTSRINLHRSQLERNRHHSKKLSEMINIYGWDNLIKEEWLNGDEEYCYIQEKLLRPKSKVGWNTKVGGGMREKRAMLHTQPIRPICKECNKNPARNNGISARGFQRWHKLCSVCAKKKYTKPSEKKQSCDNCGFDAVDQCQLNLINLDGVMKTICANCHRLIMKENNEQRRAQRQITVDATVDLNQIIQ